MSHETSSYQLYLDEPRLRMTIAGRSLVRIISYVAYLVLVVATITFLLSYDIRPLFYLGLFLVLIIADLLVHKGEGDAPISELPKTGRINLASVITPSAFLVIERAMDASIITQKSFLLEVAAKLFEVPEIENAVTRLDVAPAEFKQKLESLMAEEDGTAEYKKENYIHQSHLLIAAAFDEAVNAGHDFIQPTDLFSALPSMNDESLHRLFGIFSIESGDLRGALWFAPASYRTIRHRTKIFESIPAHAITEVDAEKILVHKSITLEKKTHITISFGAIKRAVVLARKYFGGQPLPSKAEEILKEALLEAERHGEKVLKADLVTAVVDEKMATGDDGLDGTI